MSANNSREILVDCANLVDNTSIQSNDDDDHNTPSLSLEMSIGARAAMTEHMKLVERYGIDYENRQQEGEEGKGPKDLSWSSWQPNGSLSVDVSSDYFESSRVLLLASPTSEKRTATKQEQEQEQQNQNPVWLTWKRDEEGDDEEENSTSFNVDISRISFVDDAIPTPFKIDDTASSPSSITFKPSPTSSLQSQKTSFSSTPSKAPTAHTNNATATKTPSEPFHAMISSIAAMAGHAAELVQRDDFLGEADPFPETSFSGFDLDVSAIIESDAEHCSLGSQPIQHATEQHHQHQHHRQQQRWSSTLLLVNQTHPMTVKDSRLLSMNTRTTETIGDNDPLSLNFLTTMSSQNTPNTSQRNPLRPSST